MLPTIIVFFIVLSLLIFIHELGHFLAAKKAGIKVEEFGFGYPPKIWGKKVGETVYSINAIPFGGFVRLLGQDIGSYHHLTKKALERAFFNKSKKKRALVLLAGITGNFLLGLLCFTIIYSKIGIPQKLPHLKITKVVENSPADLVSIKPEEEILMVNNKKIDKLITFMEVVEENKGKEILLTTNKNKYLLTPRENPPSGEGRLGIGITDTKMVFYPWYKMIYLSIVEGTKEALSWTGMILAGLFLTIKQLFGGITPQMAGPLGIYQLTQEAAKDGMISLMQFVGVLSINLAILNLLPFPALDGGHLAFLFLGEFIPKKKREKVEYYLNSAGFIFLISVMILVTIGDIKRIIDFNKILEFFKSLIS